MIELLPSHLASSIERLDLSIDIPQEIPELRTLLYDTVLAGGKRFRPALCFMMGEILGVSAEEIAPYARVSELMHAATLAHDDVIDEATKRRNRPTLNHIASNQKAVLTGDLLLARVVREIASLGNLDILRDGSQVLEDLVRGEWQQIDRRGKARPDRANLENAAQKKTASLIAWCCTMPARLAGNSPELVERARRFGNLVGLSFQMADDIVDFEINGEKPYANDLREGLVNFVMLEMLDKNPELVPQIQKVFDTASLEIFKDWPKEAPWTEGQLEDAKKSVREQVRNLIYEAQDMLEEIKCLSKAPDVNKNTSANILHQILAFMAERVR